MIFIQHVTWNHKNIDSLKKGSCDEENKGGKMKLFQAEKITMRKSSKNVYFFYPLEKYKERY